MASDDGHKHSNECFTVELICPKTLHSHSDRCRDKDGNLKCGMFDHPAHHPVHCTRSVRTCGY